MSLKPDSQKQSISIKTDKLEQFKIVRQPLLVHQIEFIKDITTPILSLTGGLGSGKTEAAVIKALFLAYANWPYAGLIIEPTYDQIENVFLDTMYKVLINWGFSNAEYSYNSKTHNFNILINGRDCVMRLRSADKAKNIAGANVAYAIVDEADFVYENIMNQIKARVRILDAPYRQICFVGTPERIGGWWQTLAEVVKPDYHRLIRAHTKDNYFLPANFADVSLGHLSELEKKQYLGGHWISRNGRVYTNFEPNLHVMNDSSIIPEEKDQFIMACDFGTGVMTWIMGLLRNDKVYFFDEIILEGSNTYDAAQIAAQKWRKYFFEVFGWNVDAEQAAAKVDCYIDPAGDKRRDMTASDSLFMENEGFIIMSKPEQIGVHERVQTLNFRIKQNKVFLAREGCSHSIKSLSLQEYDKWGKPQKWHSNAGAKGLDHACDAIGYFVFNYWPLRYAGNTGSYGY